MTLTGQQLARIHEAILDAYAYDDLRRVVMSAMNLDIEHHVSAKKAYSAQVFEFVTWIDQQGRALELLRCAAEGNRRNAGLQTLWTEAQGWDALAKPSKTEPSVTPAAPHHVFLAYSRKDSEVMRRLRADLLAAGIEAWIDQEDLEPGTPVWQRAIEAGIRSAKCVVIILTPDAKESDWVNIELAFARRINRRIFPVLARGDEDDAVPLALEATHRIDVRTDYAGGVRGKLIPALRKHLGATDIAMPVQQVETPVRFAKKDGKPTGIATTKPEIAKPTPQVSSPERAIVKSPIDIEWVTIPASEFLMGSDKKKDKQAYDDEIPQHRLYLPEYRIAKYPITNTQYQVFVRATGHQAPAHWQHGVIPRSRENHPVVNVSWYDAWAFCQWANVRLPSEAEWEKAARGTDGRIWPWGNEPPTKALCNFDKNVGDTTSVDRYPGGASPYGVMDMIGNVWEWSVSLWGKEFQKPQFRYPYDPEDGREDMAAAEVVRRLVRGGSWVDDDDYVRCAFRGCDAPWGMDVTYGFRVLHRSS